jgi:hypothetical protein
MLQAAFVLLLSSALLAQSSFAAAAIGQRDSDRAGSEATQAMLQQPPAAASDELTQMRDDLNKLESLNLNMSSEIEFLRDQNLQILLRTNAQMWTMLIRDLRRQVDREERARHPTH